MAIQGLVMIVSGLRKSVLEQDSLVFEVLTLGVRRKTLNYFAFIVIREHKRYQLEGKIYLCFRDAKTLVRNSTCAVNTPGQGEVNSGKYPLCYFSFCCLFIVRYIEHDCKRISCKRNAF